MESNTATSTRPYRMVARAEAVEQTQTDILDAAVAEFWAQSTTDISLDEVAARAGVSTRTILRHFGTRQGLLDAAAERERQRIERERNAARPGDVPGAVRVLVDHYEQMGDQVIRLLAEEQRSPESRGVADAGRASHRAWCQRMFADALAPFTGVDRRRRLAQLVAVCDVYTWKLLRRDAGLSRTQTERALIELLQPLLEMSP
jgi:AcrR family transcriptional regulator